MLTGYRFTSVVDTGSVLENTVALRNRVTNGEVAGPRILTAGMIIFSKDGLPCYLTESLPPEMVVALAKGVAATPADAVRMVGGSLLRNCRVSPRTTLPIR